MHATISQLSHPHICTLFDVGDGFLVHGDQTTTPASMAVVLNWSEELRALVPLGESGNT